MLRWYYERYDDKRVKADPKLIYSLLSETLKVAGVQIEESKLHEVLLLFFSSLSYYLYLHPTEYIDLSKFALYRGSRLDNLLTFEVKKEGDTAENIYSYYKEGGLAKEEFTKMVTDFVKDLASHSQKREVEEARHISKLKDLVRQRKAGNN